MEPDPQELERLASRVQSELAQIDQMTERRRQLGYDISDQPDWRALRAQAGTPRRAEAFGPPGRIRAQTLQRTGLLAALVLAATNIRVLAEAYGRDISAPAPASTSDQQSQAAGGTGRRPRRTRTPKRGTGPHRAKDPPPRTPTDTTDWVPATKAHKR